MNLSIIPNSLNGEILAPPSKSYAHRNIILACLSNSPIIVKNIGDSLDVKATIRCIQSIGANCIYDGNNLECKSFTKKESAVLDCGESGSTLRFLLPICSALGIKSKFCGSEKLFSRPTKDLINSLNLMGADIQNFNVFGKLKCGEYKINGSVSSQYISGLLMALPLINGEKAIRVNNKIVSEPYVNITLDVLEKFGIKWQRKNNLFVLLKNDKTLLNEITNEGDYSSAAFMLSAGVIGGKVFIKGLNRFSKQGDKQIVDILRAFNGDIEIYNDKVYAQKSSLIGTKIDCENIPDLVQILSVVGCYAKGKTVLENIRRLHDKESDRIVAIKKMLTTAKVNFKLNENSITIWGGKVMGGVFNSENDHRTAMSSTILATYAKGNSKIINVEAVEKSYPSFYRDFNALGGKTDVYI